MKIQKELLILISISGMNLHVSEFSSLNKDECLSFPNVALSKGSSTLSEIGAKPAYIVPVCSTGYAENDSIGFSLTGDYHLRRVICSGSDEALPYQTQETLVLVKMPQTFDAKFDLSFCFGDGSIERFTLYLKIDNFGSVAYSFDSEDAVQRFLDPASLSYSLRDERDFGSPKTNVEERMIRATSIGASGVVRGHLSWRDSAGGVHPLSGAKVMATMNGSWWQEETLTNQQGYYEIPYSDIWYVGSGKPTVHILTSGKMVDVEYDGKVYERAYEFSNSSGGVYDYCFDPNADGDMGKAISIFQGLVSFSERAEYLNGGKPIDFCHSIYPVGSKEGSSYRHDGYILVSSADSGYAGRPKSFEAWDMLGHEYGHHLEKVFNIGVMDSSARGPENNLIDANLNVDPSMSIADAKSKASHLSWKEAWPTYWSIAAQQHFRSDLKEIRTVGDTAYSSVFIDRNELDCAECECGDCSEYAISCMLYRLGSKNNGWNDLFSLGDEKMWDLVVEHKPESFESFVNCLYEEGLDRHDLAKLISQYGIVPMELKAENIYFDLTPTFSWSAFMGSQRIFYNKFNFNFEDAKGNPIFSTTVSASSDRASYSLSREEWNQVFHAPGDVFTIYLQVWQTDGYKTGGYYSERFAFPKPTKYSPGKAQVMPHEWGFDSRYYFQNEIEKDDSLRYKVFVKNKLKISTDRLRCGYIENMFVNLSPKRVDAGKAFLELTFNKPIYSFAYGICLWGPSEYIDGDVLLKATDLSGNEYVVHDFLQGKDLRTRGEGIERRVHVFSEPVHRLRFEAYSNPVGDRNKGRVCLDDLVFGLDSGEKGCSYCILDYPKTKGGSKL